MTLPWYLPTGVLVLLIGGGALALHIHDNDIRAQAILADSLQVVHRSEASLRDSLARNSKAVHQDTVVLVKWQTSYKTIRDTVLKNIHDTIAVEHFVQVSDSTIHACSVLVTDCQARTKILTEQNQALSQEAALWKRQAPNLLQRHVGIVSGATGVLGLVAGVVIGKHL